MIIGIENHYQQFKEIWDNIRQGKEAEFPNSTLNISFPEAELSASHPPAGVLDLSSEHSMTHVGVPMVVSSVESSRKRPRSSSDISESELTARSSAIDQGPTLFIMSPTSGRYIARSKSQGCEKSNTVSGIESSKSGDPAGNSGSQVSPRRHNNSASSGPSPVPTPEPLRQVPSAPPLRSPNKLLPRRPFSTANNEVATTKPEVSSNDSDDNSESEEISYFPAKILHRSQIVSHMSSIPALVPKKSPSLPDKKRNDLITMELLMLMIILVTEIPKLMNNTVRNILAEEHHLPRNLKFQKKETEQNLWFLMLL